MISRSIRCAAVLTERRFPRLFPAFHKKGLAGGNHFSYAKYGERVSTRFVGVDDKCTECEHHALSCPEGGMGLRCRTVTKGTKKEVRFVSVPRFQFWLQKKRDTSLADSNTNPHSFTSDSVPQEHSNLEKDTVLLQEPCRQATTDTHFPEQRTIATGVSRYVDGIGFGKVMHLLIWIAILTPSFTPLGRRNCDPKSTKLPVCGKIKRKLTFAQVHTQRKPPRREFLRLVRSWLWPAGVCVWAYITPYSTACNIDSTSNLSAFGCLEYDSTRSLFELTCSFDWSQSSHDCILLYKDEVFEGNNNEINITGYSNWEGLFEIANSDSTSGSGPSSLADAPLIRNVHIRGGKTSDKGGFIVQSGQKHFIVQSCSSTGVINGMNKSPWFSGGGICGNECSGDVHITNCWSSGEIRGDRAGGIAGRRVGVHGDGYTVNVSHCHSTGDINGSWSGGICGNRAGQSNGHVTITHSYSTGKIVGAQSGGICGHGAGHTNGEVTITQCYSLGEITGAQSGGIAGARAGETNGWLKISNSYSRGNIFGGSGAGGIGGGETAWGNGIVIIENVYSSGSILSASSSGILGSIGASGKSANEVKIYFSVHNMGKMVGDVHGDKYESKYNSGDVMDITQKLYCYSLRSCWDTERIWTVIPSDEFPVFLSEGYPPTSGPSSLVDAPLIRNVHIRGGETGDKGGFIVQSGQKHFIVEACSSTGVIEGKGAPHYHGGGGICGQECSGDIRITNCWSSGEIRGGVAGGITGKAVGVSGDRHAVNISHCRSTGDIIGTRSGGICGNTAGSDNGHVTITHSYSTGEVFGYRSGGICGGAAGHERGEIKIKQCYSLGEISGRQSGGIVGANAARRDGQVYITNCYSHGNITGSDNAGGICGSDTGSTSGAYDGGSVILSNLYASGDIDYADAGGIIGKIDSKAKEINITMSVYNGETGEIIGGTRDADTDEKNSGNLPGIIGYVYCYEDQHITECWNNESIWRAVEDDFPVLQGMPSVAPSTTPSPAPSASLPSSGTHTSTPSSTGTLSPSESGTFSPSSSPSQRPRRIFTQLPVQRPRRKVHNRG